MGMVRVVDNGLFIKILTRFENKKGGPLPDHPPIIRNHANTASENPTGFPNL